MAADLEHRSPDATQWAGGSSAATARATAAAAVVSGGSEGRSCNASASAGVTSVGAGGRGGLGLRQKVSARRGGTGGVEHEKHQQSQQQSRLDRGDHPSRRDEETAERLRGCSGGSSAGGVLELRRAGGDDGGGLRRSERRRRGRSVETMDTESPASVESKGTYGVERGGNVENPVGSRGIGLEEKGGGDDPGGTVSEEAVRGEQEVAARPAANRLAYKLSVSLIDTYKLINQRYYAEKQRQQEQASQASAAGEGSGEVSGVAGSRSGKAPARQGGVYNHGMDDENFDYIVHDKEVFKGRYSVRETIGKGSFGKVYKAWDAEERIWVALKLIKSKKPFTMQAKVEVEILELLRDRDPEGKYNCARMLDHFMSNNHQCLVFEILSFNLYELLRSTQFQGVSLHLVRKFARHLLRALAFLSLPQVDVIHCDLKPENILLQHAKRSNIKVIDFGSSCRSNNKMYSYIQSRFYRSPEVMLGLPYTTAIDMWSLGCILVEMHTGEPLFAGVDQFDQMCRIVSVLGMTPSDVVERSPATHRSQFFEVDDSSDDGHGEGDSQEEGAGDRRSPGLARKTRSATNRRNPSLRRRQRRNEALSDAVGVSTRGRRARGGDINCSSTDEDDSGDHAMADYCATSTIFPSSPKSDSSAPAPPANRYRLRKSLLLKRARKHGNNSGGSGSTVGNPGAGSGWHLPRVPLSDIVGVESGGPSGRRDGEPGHDPGTYALFVNLMERMLDQRPETRITPAEALLHPFLVDPLSSHVAAPPPATQAERDVDSWLAEGSVSPGEGNHTTPPHPPYHQQTPPVGSENGSIVNFMRTPDGMQSELSASTAAALVDSAAAGSAGNVGDDGGRGGVRKEGLVSSTSPPQSQSKSPHRPRSAPSRTGASGSASDGNSGNNASRYRRCRVPEASAAEQQHRTECSSRGRRRMAASGAGGKSSGGGCSSGGGRGGGKGAASGSGSGSGSTRGRGLRRGRSRGQPQGDSGGGGVGDTTNVAMNWDGSAKRPGRRREAEGVVGDDVRLSRERGREAGSSGVVTRAAEGHVEAVSRVAQLSLHSSGTSGRAGRRGTSAARRHV